MNLTLPFSRHFDLKKLEQQAAITLYVLTIMFMIPKISTQGFQTTHAPNSFFYENKQLEYSFFANYFLPQLVRYTFSFGSFLLLSFYVMPALMRKERVELQVVILILLYVLNAFLFGVTDTWLKSYELVDYGSLGDGYAEFFQRSFIYCFWLFVLFGFYTTMKYLAYGLMERAQVEHDGRQMVIRDGLVAMMLWMISSILILNSYAQKEFVLFWMVIIPFAIGLYSWSLYRLIPRVKEQGKGFWRYWGELWIILVLSFVPLFIISLTAFSYNPDAGIVINLFNLLFQLGVTAPVCWYLFKYRKDVQTEILGLKTALGKSNAGLDFLRSQINPHFLYNSMNTLYGTALQEQAGRTAEGIQKLSEMMRFMLDENIQDEIALNRELDYLKNYIGLQKLRTGSTPDIKIETELEEHISSLRIAPMLLIPFVENAFKHGISLREPSHIRIALHTKEQKLFFDVNNSIHLRSAQDPEYAHSGIGLENVKQRLSLVYPGRHELVIRETGRDYFIHLTVDLKY